jgi:hypothetical protein
MLDPGYTRAVRRAGFCYDLRVVMRLTDENLIRYRFHGV